MHIRSASHALEIFDKLELNQHNRYRCIEANTITENMQKQIKKIKKSDISDKDKIIQMTAIFTGALIAVMAYEDRKYHFRTYPIHFDILVNRYSIKTIKDTNIWALRFGQAVLDGELPFNESILRSKFEYKDIECDSFPGLSIACMKALMELIFFCKWLKLSADKLMQCIAQDLKNNTLIPIALETFKLINKLSDDERLSLINTIEPRNTPTTFLACALLLCGADIRNLDTSHSINPSHTAEYEKRTHDVLDYLNKAGSDPQLKPFGESLLCCIRDVTPYRSVRERLIDLPLAYSESYIPTIKKKTNNYISAKIPDFVLKNSGVNLFPAKKDKQTNVKTQENEKVECMSQKMGKRSSLN